MKNPIKKVAAIHDMSGFGRAALTTIIPVLSTMGIQVCPFPTSILSTHTGGFKEPYFIDLTHSMRAYMKHWKDEEIEFDCIYSGYLGSVAQVDIILDFIHDFKTESNIVVVDPVMADVGKLYSSMTDEMVIKMKELIRKADIITPNLTEALYLSNRNQTHTCREKDIKAIMVELSTYGPDIVIITSVPDENSQDNISVYAYDKNANEFWKITNQRLPVNFPGTGDTFTSVLIGKLLGGYNLIMAMEESVEFVTFAMKESIKYSYPKREGILLEKVLYKLNSKYKNC